MKSAREREKVVMAMSLPSRGAWIEIPAIRETLQPGTVAPLAGSVD